MYQYYTLSNGIRIILNTNHSAVTHAGVFVNVGSRDEEGQLEGIAHFIEHSIFKGTEHRRSYHIRNRIDGVGGELDAFTTKEETCIYASVLSEHLERSLELFSDILFHSTFPDHELEKEKDVVLEEINLYNDSPADLIYDDFEELIFGTHPLAHNILGSKKNVKRFNSETLHQFMSSRYSTDRMVVSVVGNVEMKRLVRLCEKYFGDQPCNTSSVNRKPVESYCCFNRTVNRHTHQVHALLGCPAPHIFDGKKTAFSLLNNLVGGPAMNSRLNVAVREKYGFCYTIESQYVPFSDAGLFYIYAGVDGDAQEHATQLIFDEMRKLREVKLTDQQLRAVQRQFVGQMAITNESGLNEMQSIGKAFLNYDHVDSLEEMNRDIYSVTAQEIQDLANELLVEDQFSQLFFKGNL